jgi:hypothetical protein
VVFELSDLVSARYTIETKANQSVSYPNQAVRFICWQDNVKGHRAILLFASTAS